MRIEMGHWIARLRPLGAVLLLTLLAACSHPHIEVVRTQSLPSDAPKASFIMLQSATQEGDANYDRFADQIAQHLISQGFTRVTTAAKARYAVMFTTDEPDPEAENRSSKRRRAKDKDKETRHYDNDDGVERSLTIAIFDLTRPNSSGEKVFGAFVKSPSRKDGGGLVTPAMIDAALKDFPGEESESYKVRLRDEE